MRKLIKTLSTLIIIFVLLISGSAFYLVRYVNPNDFKEKITALISERTGRKLTIQGDMTWALLPWLSLKVNNITLSNTSDFAFENFAHIGEATISVKLFPLLFHHIQINRLRLNDVSVELIKSVTGQNNWQDLVNSNLKSPKIDNNPIKKSADYNLTSFNVDNVEITNATVSWQDRITNKTIVFGGISFRSKNLNFNDPFSFKLNFVFNNNLPDLKFMPVGESGQLFLKGTIQVNFAKHIYSFLPLEVTGRIRDQRLSYPVPIQMTLNAIMDLSAQNLSITNLKAKIATVKFQADIQGHKLLDAPTFFGKIIVNNFNLGNCLRKFFHIVNLNHQKLLTETGAEFDFEVTSRFIKIPHLLFTADDSQITGHVNFMNFSSKYLDFDLRANYINLDNYLSFKKLVQIQTKKTAKTANSKLSQTDNFTNDNAYIDYQSHNITFDGNVKIDKLIINKLQFNNFNADVTGTNKNISLKPFTVKAYNGSLKGVSNINFQPKHPVKITANLEANDVSIQPLLKDLANFDGLSGNLLLQTNIEINRDTNSGAFLKNLQGTGRFIVSNGVWHGVNINYIIGLANAITNNVTHPQESSISQTEFNQLSGTFKIKNGIFSNDNLMLKAQQFNVHGAGQANLFTKDINFHLQATNTGKNKNLNFDIPINISGSLDKLQIQPDLKKITVKKIQQTISKTIDKELDKLHINHETSKKILKTLKFE